LKKFTTGSNSAPGAEWLEATVCEIVATSPHLLHVLYALQRQCLYISDAAISCVARQLDLPLSQVKSVVEFYSFFSQTPQGRYHFQFSSCTSCGDLGLMHLLGQLLNVVAGITRADGLVSLAPTSCIGMCDHGASLMINGRPIIRLDADVIGHIASLIEAETPLSDWPAAWFYVDDHIRASGLLLDENAPAGDALRATFARGEVATLAEISQSGLRGRGGAGFGTGMKWQFCREAMGESHYVVCNADEGEPGTFKDRILLNNQSDRLFEGMTVCAAIIGAKQGFLYLRGEYRYLLPTLQAVLSRRREQNLLGDAILGDTEFCFDIEIVVGAGAYICGEESALIESLEGKPGIPRNRPPFPVTCGYQGQPTVVNNVETFVAAAGIALHGADWLRKVGTAKSAGSKLLSVSGDCSTRGIYEYPFGVTVQQVLDDCGALDVQAVQIGGPSGTLIAPDEFNRKLCFEDLPTGGSFMVFGQQRNLLEIISNFAHFFAHESCGFCTPCRVGTTLLKNGLDKIAAGNGTQYDLDEMRQMAALVKRRSHCGLGQTAANPILDGLQRFPLLFEQRLLHNNYQPHFNLDAALEDARNISCRDDVNAHLAEEKPA
jgi:[NiFe] hydrogenase diaphorase moiety large subunit